MSEKQRTFRDKVNDYLDNFTKHQLAIMLVLRDEGQIKETAPFPTPCPAPIPQPYVPSDAARSCQSWKDCTNPHYDCINCPLRYKATDTTPWYPTTKLTTNNTLIS